MTRGFFLWLSERQSLKRLTREVHPFWRLASRFVAGHTLNEAMEVVRSLNQEGIKVTLDHLGENTTNPEEAIRAGEAYLDILRRIHQERLDASISLKLTQMGLDLSDRIVRDIMDRIVSLAYELENFVRIDMESSTYTQKTLDLFYWLHGKYNGHVGIVIQAYLYRSEQDIRDLIEIGANVRLCKGAYKEPPEIAFPKKRDVDENYKRLLALLLSEEAIEKGTFTAIATHDEVLIQYTKDLAAERKISTDHFEFQMLYGIRNDLQRALVREGYRVRVYVPFGTEWYPYFMRRLAERPANVFFVLKNLFR